MKTILKYWVPAVLWIAVINLMSTGLFSSGETGKFVYAILHRLGVDPRHWELLHFLIRKGAHVTEYSILSGTLFWALRGTTWTELRQAWNLRWAGVALAMCAGVATIDEIHQVFVPSRGPSVHDVLLDTTAAALLQVVLWLALRRRSRGPRPTSLATARSQVPSSV